HLVVRLGGLVGLTADRRRDLPRLRGLLVGCPALAVIVRRVLDVRFRGPLELADSGAQLPVGRLLRAHVDLEPPLACELGLRGGGGHAVLPNRSHAVRTARSGGSSSPSAPCAPARPGRSTPRNSARRFRPAPRAQTSRAGCAGRRKRHPTGRVRRASAPPPASAPECR